MVSRRRLTWIPSHFVAESNPTPRSAPVSGNAPATARLVAIVTGAGAGIGQALTRELVSRGHTVYAGVRDLKRARGSDLKDIVDRSGLRLVELDVNKPAHVTRVMQQIQKEAGRVDVLVNNAGYGLYGAFEELPEAEFRAQLETNLFGAMRMARAVLPGMRERGQGRILNVSSILGRMGLPTGSAYTALKWALEAFSESLRYEVLPFGIYTCLIEPGLIRTNFKQNMRLAIASESNQRAKKKSKASNARGAVAPQTSPYRFLTAQIGRDYDGGFSSSAESAARRIAGIVENPRPALRYRVGLDSHGYNFLRRVLPEFVFDGLLRAAVYFMKRRADRDAHSAT